MAHPCKTFHYGEDYLSAGIALSIARGITMGQISPLARKKMPSSYTSVAHIVKIGKPVYGINTGFGPLCTVKISPTETKILQTNILKSHSVGVGLPIDTELAKLMMILKVHSLA